MNSRPYVRLAILPVLFLIAACVPKQQYDDQQTKLREAQEKLRSAEQQASECDPNAFMQLKEQSQSLDLLTQELVDRNTELSKEVARLRTMESSCKVKDQECSDRIDKIQQDARAKEERLRRTYEDLIKELRVQVKKLEDQASKASEAPKATSKDKKAAKPAAKEPAKTGQPPAKTPQK